MRLRAVAGWLLCHRAEAGRSRLPPRRGPHGSAACRLLLTRLQQDFRQREDHPHQRGVCGERAGSCLAGCAPPCSCRLAQAASQAGHEAPRPPHTWHPASTPATRILTQACAHAASPPPGRAGHCGAGQGGQQGRGAGQPVPGKHPGVRLDRAGEAAEAAAAKAAAKAAGQKHMLPCCCGGAGVGVGRMGCAAAGSLRGVCRQRGEGRVRWGQRLDAPRLAACPALT